MTQVSKVTQTGVGSTDTIQIRPANPFAIGMGAIVSGTVTYNVEHSFDPDSNEWFTHTNLVDKTVSCDGNYAFPIAALRLTITAGTGSVKLTVIQTDRS